MTDELLKEVMELGEDVIASERFAKAKTVPHHSKDGNIAAHSLKTAGYGLQLARWLNKKRHAGLDEREVVRTCLLHDIGMTEDEVFLSPSPVKAKTHPVEGARIAQEEFDATDEQVDAILYHMWPFCSAVPPHSTLGFVVTMADKYCSLSEVRHRFLPLGD